MPRFGIWKKDEVETRDDESLFAVGIDKENKILYLYDNAYYKWDFMKRVREAFH
jgi:hypothetical protein